MHWLVRRMMKRVQCVCERVWVVRNVRSLLFSIGLITHGRLKHMRQRLWFPYRETWHKLDKTGTCATLG